MSDCIFCKIASGEISCKKIYEDEKVTAFCDIQPQAQVHVLIIPKEHLASMLDVADEAIVGHMALCANRIAKELEVDESGFRLVINTGKDAGQSVHHLHMHLLGGRPFAWPAG